MKLETAELIVRWAGAVAALAWFVIAFGGAMSLRNRPKGRTTGIAAKILRWPIYIVGLAVFIAFCYFLWKPVPFTLSPAARTALLVAGFLLYFPAIAFYFWGRFSLGNMFGGSCGFYLPPHPYHKLITYGPFAIVRHPLYLGIMIAILGGLLLYQTWAMVLMIVVFIGLPIRAKREEEALAAEFGEEWKAYRSRVPAFIPRFWQKKANNQTQP